MARGMTLEQWIEKARAMRADVMRADVEYLLFLVDSEDTAPWRGAFTTFEQALSQYDLVRVERFVSFKRALERVPDRALALRVGAYAFTRAAKVEDPELRGTTLKELDLKTEAHGVPLSDEEINRVVQRLAPVARPPLQIKKAAQQAQIEAENASLRRRVRELEKAPRPVTDELTRLREENARLKVELSAARRRIAELEGELPTPPKRRGSQSRQQPAL
jgi:hypothetical protein